MKINYLAVCELMMNSKEAFEAHLGRVGVAGLLEDQKKIKKNWPFIWDKYK